MEQKSFSRLWDSYASDKEAMIARNLEAKKLRKEGKKVRCWLLKNQFKKYAGFGQPDGRACTVYMIDIY